MAENFADFQGFYQSELLTLSNSSKSSQRQELIFICSSYR